MSGTFGSLNTALSALRYNQVVLDTANNNIANAGTDGYTRQRVESSSVSGGVSGLWSRAETSPGYGVSVDGITRMTDAVLDARSRQEHSKQAYLDTRQTVLERVESGIGEPGDSGVSAALSNFRSALQDLSNQPGQAASRSQALATASTVADAFRVQVSNIDSEAAQQRATAQALVTQVNTVAGSLASTNAAIARSGLGGSVDNTLLDQRDKLAAQLADLTGAVSTVQTDGTIDVTLGGVALVTGNQASQLAIASGITATGEADGSPVTFSISDGATTTTVPDGQLGQLGATAELLNTTLPAYRAGLDAVAKTFADQMNAQQSAGYDALGAAGSPLFSYDPANVAGSLSVAITDPDGLAASGVAGGAVDGSNADAMAALSDADSAYQRLVNGFGTQVQSAQQVAANQQALTTQVDNAHEQLAGVNTDEETLNLMTAQRGYEAAARVLTTMDSILDTLIHHTGVG